MKMPQLPPDESAILRDVAKIPQRMEQIFKAAAESSMKGRYLHWDKVMHLEPPAGLSRREWWLGIKMRRKALYREVPLLDKSGNPFVYAEVESVLERLHRIDAIASGQRKMPEILIGAEARSAYSINSMIEEAITSSQIEGASTTREVAKEMIRSGRPPRDRSERMIQNNFQVMQRIGEWKEEPLTPDLVFSIHRLATENTLDDPSAAGRLRKPDEIVHVADEIGQVFHVPPRAEDLQRRLSLMCDFANGKIPQHFIHPVIRSIILHFWLSYDHPFTDGNGRTARALFFWSILRHGYGLFEFLPISRIIQKGRAKYGYAFLHTETDANDLTYFILYHLDIIGRSIEDFEAYIKEKADRLKTLERSSETIALLNFRQQALVAHALQNPSYRYTIHSHQASHKVVYQTARTDLLDLVSRGLLRQEKVGKTYFFKAVDELDKALARRGESK